MYQYCGDVADSRDLLQRVRRSFSPLFSFGTLASIDVGYSTVRATRLLFREAGWELDVRCGFPVGGYESLTAAGKEFGY